MLSNDKEQKICSLGPVVSIINFLLLFFFDNAYVIKITHQNKVSVAVRY